MARVCRRGIGLIRLRSEATSFCRTMQRLETSHIVMARSAGCLEATEVLADAARRKGVGAVPVEEI
jgi:hypothetical protein